MQDFIINVTGSGDTTLIPAPTVTGQFIRVEHYHLTSDRPVTVQLLATDGTVKDIIYSTLASGGGIVTPSFTGGVLDLPLNTGLKINLSIAASVGGAGKYVVKGGLPTSNAL